MRSRAPHGGGGHHYYHEVHHSDGEILDEDTGRREGELRTRAAKHVKGKGR